MSGFPPGRKPQRPFRFRLTLPGEPEYRVLHRYVSGFGDHRAEELVLPAGELWRWAKKLTSGEHLYVQPETYP